ncbi:MAG: hypothetical protein JXR70_18010 [Spirochaetales bacterium]|nr:hypothetical protein [Spirochaetales bacterium]
MPIVLKFMNTSDTHIKKLGFCMDNDDDLSIEAETALKEGFTASQETLERLIRLTELGQKFEEITNSNKSDFSVLEEE